MMIGPRPESRICASGACLDFNSQIGKHTPDKRSYGIFELGDSLKTFTVPNKNLMTTASDVHYSFTLFSKKQIFWSKTQVKSANAVA